MDLTLSIPDDLLPRLGNAGAAARRALEAFGLAEYRAGRLSGPELGRLLGFQTRFERHGFLKAHQVFDDYGLADLERDRETLNRLGI